METEQFPAIAGRGIRKMFVKGTNMQLEDKFCRSNTQHSDCSQQYFNVAKKLDLKYSHHKKKK